ncbi:splicing factor-like protein 1 isoform X2 [Panicum virgatum]|uniref:splicing factor-like protein 1 isoform X2 n=1 Tax=Panicum virgatum TaxID=38727 RepID=UPI0019D62E08|nr:splicing factor-like protein 1 isoform X2 [Panicum virgatum]XP_039852389.1 splicing factor-like protein 1 isoform X2 [Panicum virgatum]
MSRERLRYWNLKEAKLLAEGHPGHGIIGVLIGPESNTQKQLHEETGAVIQVYGTKKINGKMTEIHYQDINEIPAAYEDLHINVSADSYDKVDAAVALIELLLSPVSVKSTTTSTTTTVSSAVTSGDVNPVQNTTSQQAYSPRQKIKILRKR